MSNKQEIRSFQKYIKCLFKRLYRQSGLGNDFANLFRDILFLGLISVNQLLEIDAYANFRVCQAMMDDFADQEEVMTVSDQYLNAHHILVHKLSPLRDIYAGILIRIEKSIWREQRT